MDDADTTRLLVWDEPDMRAALASVLVAEPEAPPDVDLTAVYLWLEGRCQGDQEPEAQLFASVVAGSEADTAEHITAVRTSGFGVVARPSRPGPASLQPLTSALVAQLDRASAQGRLAEVIVASHDGAGLRSRLEELAGTGVPVTVVGFRERAGFAADSVQLGFLDLEEIAGVFAAPLPRTNLYDLPEEGVSLPPLRRPNRSTTTAAPDLGARVRTLHRPVRRAWATTQQDRPGADLGGSPEDSSPADPLAADGPAGGASPDPATAEASDLAGSAPVEPPPSGPSTAGALDDLLAGVQATPLAATPPSPEAPPTSAPGVPRPGRVSPPNGEIDQD